MTILTINGSANVVRGVNADYGVAHANCENSFPDNSTPYVGQNLSSIDGKFYIFRCPIKFDTSTIPINVTINRVYLNLSVKVDRSTTDFDVGIGKYDWGAYDPITAGNREAVYDGVLSTGYDKIWRNTDGISQNTYYASQDLDVAWINRAGNTYFSLISSRDLAGIEPSGNEEVDIDMQTKIAQLIVEYTPATIKGVQSISGVQSITF